MKNKITDLRDHLFATLEALADKENPMELERAQTIAEVAQVVVNSAKVEVEFLKVTGKVGGSEFLEAQRAPALEAPKPRAMESR